LTEINPHKDIEILAPAGSYTSFKAALLAGADAVYAGGPRFGARAFADNFTEEELLHAIDYAHLHGRKLYLTLNTLLKEDELENLYAYLYPFYRGGLDAVIVQDIGVLDYIHDTFPDLSIHASTQMTITNTHGALFLKKQGVERIVPARELSLKEVRAMRIETELEIECFVHGALCYCYSGQCLLSSMIGGRSGNRGQCAQPCRLPYTVNKKKENILSLKDICTLDLIPELIEAGITSFKIEGRMKKPEYVALVTSMYRKYTDLYLRDGKTSFKVESGDKEMLMDIYNRGGFSSGYYHQDSGRQMLSLQRSGHTGVPAVQITSQKGRDISGKTLTDIYKGDIIETSMGQAEPDAKSNYTFGESISRGKTIKFLAPKKTVYPHGTILNRIRRTELLERMKHLYETEQLQIQISGRFHTAVGKPALLTLTRDDTSVTTQTEENTEEAQNQPVDADRIHKQLMKTGNTDFVFNLLDVQIEGSAFLPMQRINELRRRALELLSQQMIIKHHRENNAAYKITKKTLSSAHEPPFLSVLVLSAEQAWTAVHSTDVKRIYIESCIYNDYSEQSECKELCNTASENGKEIFLALPHIFRTNAVDFFSSKYVQLLQLNFDGVLIRNYECFHFLSEQGFDKKIILDHNLYIFNKSAKEFWEKQNIYSFTAPVELNRTELGRLGITSAELIIYGRLPVMVSAQCVVKSTSGCKHSPGFTEIEDRYHKKFPVNNCCTFCYNVIYNSSPLFLLDQKPEIEALSPKSVRIQLTQENEEETKRILKSCRDIYFNDIHIETSDIEYTRGHFKRGIT
jgi:putative protease